MLDKQIYLYSLPTNAFYTEHEQEMDSLKHELTSYKDLLKDQVDRMKKIEGVKLKIKDERVKIEALGNEEDDKTNRKKLLKCNDVLEKLTKQLDTYEENLVKCNNKVQLAGDDIRNKYGLQSMDHKKFKKEVNKLIRYFDGKLKESLESYDGVRQLRSSELKNSNVISQFTSTLTRTLGIPHIDYKSPTNDPTLEMIIIRAFHYNAFKSLMLKGFTYLGEHYEFYASSAGQTRNKKSIFLKSSAYNKHKNKLLCGLDIEKDVNKKEFIHNGEKYYGACLTKMNAYIALSNTSSDLWTDFNIDQAIVVDDFETDVTGVVDYIKSDYTIEHNKEMDDISINHVDGAGMYLPSTEPNVKDKSLQVRLPFMKGLMIPFPYDKFISKFKCSGKVKDVYGKEWDIINDGIKYIFTKSQFKMWRYYMSGDKDINAWQKYQKAFKEFECEAVICKEESDTFKDKTLSYQAIQSLNRLMEEEMRMLTYQTNNKIDNIVSTKENYLAAIGADDGNDKKDNYQKAVQMYPALLTDNYSKKIAKDIKASMIKQAKAGKIILNAKRSYVAPDLYAFCQHLFLGIEKPIGLIPNGRVSCKLFKDNKRLVLVRSPHNYREHSLNKNINNKVTDEWFLTNDIYLSSHSLISKLLMLDWDGDDCLAISDWLFYKISKWHMKGINPLHYEMGKAYEEIVEPENLFNSLIAAYSKNSSIGVTANQISKIWNSKNPDIDIIRLLCFQGNAELDYAKTKWLPERPRDIDIKIKVATSSKLAHFFKYAKDKDASQIEHYKKGTKTKDKFPVDMLEDIITKNNITFAKLDYEFNYKLLMRDRYIKVDQAVIDVFEKVNKTKVTNLKKQKDNIKDNRNKGKRINAYDEIVIKLLEVNGNKNQVADMLVKHLYSNDIEAKDSLWKSPLLSEILLKNLDKNLYGIVRCEDCKEIIQEPKRKQLRCEPCKKNHDNELNTNRQTKFREHNAIQKIKII